MSTPAARALAHVGKAQYSGLCEMFTRTCFGFPARYASARLAYLASKAAGKIHTDTSPPPGVPVFFDITAGPNARYDHVAVSVGGGYCVSTSVGPGKTVARVKISAFGKTIWPGAIKYVGWAEVYHGRRVYTPPKNTAPKPRTTLRRGMKGEDVEALQRALNRFKATPDRRWPGGDLLVDGDYGSYTQARVRDLQRRNGLHVDGIAGPITLGFLGVS